MALQQYEKAASSFQQAHVLSERPEDLFKAAEANKKLGRYEAADQQFNYVVQKAQTPRPLVISSFLELARMAVIKKEKQDRLGLFPEGPGDGDRIIRRPSAGRPTVIFCLAGRKRGCLMPSAWWLRNPMRKTIFCWGPTKKRLGDLGPAAEAYDQAAELTQDAPLLAEVYHRLGVIALKTETTGSGPALFPESLPAVQDTRATGGQPEGDWTGPDGRKKIRSSPALFSGKSAG